MYKHRSRVSFFFVSTWIYRSEKVCGFHLTYASFWCSPFAFLTGFLPSFSLILLKVSKQGSWHQARKYRLYSFVPRFAPHPPTAASHSRKMFILQLCHILKNVSAGFEMRSFTTARSEHLPLVLAGQTHYYDVFVSREYGFSGMY